MKGVEEMIVEGRWRKSRGIKEWKEELRQMKEEVKDEIREQGRL